MKNRLFSILATIIYVGFVEIAFAQYTFPHSECITPDGDSCVDDYRHWQGEQAPDCQTEPPKDCDALVGDHPAASCYDCDNYVPVQFGCSCPAYGIVQVKGRSGTCFDYDYCVCSADGDEFFFTVGACF